MPFIPIPNLRDARESEPVAEGDYEVMVRKVEVTESKKGTPMIVLHMNIVGQPNAAPFREWMTLPTDSTPPDQLEMRRRDIARVLHAFGIDYAEDDGIDTEKLQGSQATVHLQKQVNDDTGDEFNRVRWPRLS